MNKLHEIFSYDPRTGELRWKTTNYNKRQKAGELAGSLRKDGYIRVCVDKVHYRRARLAWFLSYGYWPREIDHINRIRNDDRLANLREVSHSINGLNTAARTQSGVKGIYWDKKRQKWTVSLTRNYIAYSLGRYETFYAAREALQNFLRLRGEID